MDRMVPLNERSCSTLILFSDTIRPMRTNSRYPIQLVARGFVELVSSIDVDVTKHAVDSIRPVLGVFYFDNENRSKGERLAGIFRDLDDEVFQTSDRTSLHIGLDLWAHNIIVGRWK